MPKILYKEMPNDYPVCLHADCPCATTCLHQVVYDETLEKREYVNLINPLRCTQGDDCPYYRNNAPVRYARGFKNFQKKMYPGQYQKFMGLLQGRFGRNPYFERRRGQTALSPDEQQEVLQALRLAGIDETWEFDAYEENINWYD